MRLVGSALAGVGCLLLGLAAAYNLRESVDRLAAQARLLETLLLYLREEALPLPQVLEKTAAAYPSHPLARRLALTGRLLAANPALSPLMAYDRAEAAARPGETGAERELAREWLGQLSSGSMALAEQGTRQAIRRTEALLAEARRREARSAALYRSFGMIGGLTLFLLLI